MPTSREKLRWIQGGLAVLIVLILAFLVVAPGARADSAPLPEGQAHTTSLSTGETK